MASRLTAALLSLASLLQASPLNVRRQYTVPITTDTLVITASSGNISLFTFTPSRASDAALWTVSSPTTITSLGSTETLYPSGYEWAYASTSDFVPPAIPTDAPYPFPGSLLSAGSSSLNSQNTTSLPNLPSYTISSSTNVNTQPVSTSGTFLTPLSNSTTTSPLAISSQTLSSQTTTFGTFLTSLSNSTTTSPLAVSSQTLSSQITTNTTPSITSNSIAANLTSTYSGSASTNTNTASSAADSNTASSTTIETGSFSSSTSSNTDASSVTDTNTVTITSGPSTTKTDGNGSAYPGYTTFPTVVPSSSATDAFNDPSKTLTTISVSGEPALTYSKETFSDLSTITAPQTVSTTAVETDSEGHTSTFIGPIVVGPGGVFWGPPGLPPVPVPPGVSPPCIWPFCSGGGGSESSGDDNGSSKTNTPTTDPSTTNSQTTTSETESCTSSSAVPQCTETISLSTSFLSDNPSSSTVQTITSTACTTITTCDAGPTTATTTVSTTTSSGGFVCETGCASCLDKRDVYSRGRFSDLRVRSLDNLDDWSGELDSYVMEQVTSGGDNQELNWNFASQDAVSLSAELKDAPLVRWITGIQGCTSITIISEQGLWTSHFMEPGFMDRDNYDISRWNDRIIAAMENGASKFSKPADLAGDGGILNPANNVQILVSTPKDAAGNLLYQTKIDTLLSYLTGNGAPWAGITPDIRGYLKPVDESQAAQRKNTAYYKVMIEYDNNQLDDDGNQPTSGQEAIYRVWREQDHVDHTWTAKDNQKGGGSCPVGNQKRDGSCSSASGSASASDTSASQTSGSVPSTITPPPTMTSAPTSTASISCSYHADPDAGPGQDGCQCDGMTGLFPILPSTSDDPSYQPCAYTTPPPTSSTSISPFTTTSSDGLVISCASSSYANYAVNENPSCAGATAVVSTVASIASVYASSTSAAAASASSASSASASSASASSASAADASWSAAAASPSAGCWILDDDGFGDSLFQVYGINDWAGPTGESLFDQEDGCGIISGWEFHPDGEDEFQGRERPTQWAVFGLSFFKGGCVERAVHSAGGPEPGKGDGQLACQHGPPEPDDALLSAKSNAKSKQVTAVQAVANGDAPPMGTPNRVSSKLAVNQAETSDLDDSGLDEKPSPEMVSSAKAALPHLMAAATGSASAPVET